MTTVVVEAVVLVTHCVPSATRTGIRQSGPVCHEERAVLRVSARTRDNRIRILVHRHALYVQSTLTYVKLVHRLVSAVTCMIKGRGPS